MRIALPAVLAFAGGTLSLSSLTFAGLVVGLALLAVGDVLVVASLSRRMAAGGSQGQDQAQADGGEQRGPGATAA